MSSLAADLQRTQCQPPPCAPCATPQVVARTMDYFKFMNTKVLFKQVRHMPKDQQPKPVMGEAGRGLPGRRGAATRE